MFANFTEETATESGGVLTLLGATAGMLPFSAKPSFVDGSLVSYVVENTAKTKRSAGVGVFNRTANTITKADTWTQNGTTVDESPIANLDLSAEGTLAVRCDVVSSTLKPLSLAASGRLTPIGITGTGAGIATAMGGNNLRFALHYIPAGTTVTGVTFGVVTAVASSSTKVGICLATPDRNVGESLGESIAITTDTIISNITGTLTTPVYFPEDTYIYSWLCSDSAIDIAGWNRNNFIAALPTLSYTNNDYRIYSGVTSDTIVGAPNYPPLPMSMNRASSGTDKIPALFIEVTA